MVEINVCADQQFKAKQDTTADIGPVTRVRRAPISRARTLAEKRRCGQDNSPKDDGHAGEFEQFGKLIDEDMGLLKHANSPS